MWQNSLQIHWSPSPLGDNLRICSLRPKQRDGLLGTTTAFEFMSGISANLFGKSFNTSGVARSRRSFRNALILLHVCNHAMPYLQRRNQAPARILAGSDRPLVVLPLWRIIRNSPQRTVFCNSRGVSTSRPAAPGDASSEMVLSFTSLQLCLRALLSNRNPVLRRCRCSRSSNRARSRNQKARQKGRVAA